MKKLINSEAELKKSDALKNMIKSQVMVWRNNT